MWLWVLGDGYGIEVESPIHGGEGLTPYRGSVEGLKCLDWILLEDPIIILEKLELNRRNGGNVSKKVDENYPERLHL